MGLPDAMLPIKLLPLPALPQNYYIALRNDAPAEASVAAD